MKHTGQRTLKHQQTQTCVQPAHIGPPLLHTDSNTLWARRGAKHTTSPTHRQQHTLGQTRGQTHHLSYTQTATHSGPDAGPNTPPLLHTDSNTLWARLGAKHTTSPTHRQQHTLGQTWGQTHHLSYTQISTHSGPDAGPNTPHTRLH
ncbi:hypothetical protein ACOMHN_021384 [Nucella lapillus]